MAWGVAVEPSRPCTQRGGAGRVSLCGLPLGPGPPQVPLLPTSPSGSQPSSLQGVDISMSEFREDGDFYAHNYILVV